MYVFYGISADGEVWLSVNIKVDTQYTVQERGRSKDNDDLENSFMTCYRI